VTKAGCSEWWDDLRRAQIPTSPNADRCGRVAAHVFSQLSYSSSSLIVYNTLTDDGADD
jgi:hypothetical protein